MDNDQVAAGQDEEQAQAAEMSSGVDSGAVETPEPTGDPQVAQPEAEAPAASAAPAAGEQAAGLDDLKPGMTMRGKVRNVVDFGAFIDIGVGRDGLAHVSTLKRAGIDQTIKVGDEIDVVIRRVDTDNNRISLTVPRAEREVKASLSKVEVGSVVTGKVMRLVDFGAFVDIGAPTDGLLHVSQLQGGFVRHPSEVLNVGDELQVRVLDVDVERRRISLTMRNLDGAEQEEAPSRPAYEGPAPDRQRSGRPSGRGQGRGRGRSAEPAYQPEPQDEFPTALELAFQQAVADRKRRKRRETR